MGVGVGEISSVGLKDGTILPKRVRKAAEILLLESMTIIKKIKARNISISLLDVISLLRQ